MVLPATIALCVKRGKFDRRRVKIIRKEVCQIELPEHRLLLAVMCLHPAQDVVQRPQRLEHMRPLLSITHSARSLIAASVISARDGRPVRASVSSTCVARSPTHAPLRRSTKSLPAVRTGVRSRIPLPSHLAVKLVVLEFGA